MNYTTIFLLPALKYDDSLFPEEFISAYIVDKLQTKLALVFENSDSEKLAQTLEQFQSHEQFDSMDYDDSNKEVIVFFNFPKDYDTDFRLFKIGRYSKFSNPFKELLLTRHGRKTGNGKCIMMIDALMPDHKAKKFKAEKLGVSANDLPGGEVMSIPDMDKELYYKIEELDKIEKYINK